MGKKQPGMKDLSLMSTSKAPMKSINSSVSGGGMEQMNITGLAKDASCKGGKSWNGKSTWG